MIDNHPPATEAMDYLEIARKRVKGVDAELAAGGEHARRRAEVMDVTLEADQLAKVHDALEVLNWDSSLVAVKINRIISRLCNDGDDDPDDKEFPRQDARATAALVFYCLNRDKQALLTIHDWHSDHQDTAVELLAKAARIGRALKAVLPAEGEQLMP